jgi:hypothetical protein
VRWIWPPARLADQCLLAVCRDEPPAGADPMELDPLYCQIMDRSAWENAGGNRLLKPQPDWAGAYVAVWARVDLGFRAFYSDPLILGRFPQKPSGIRALWGTLWRPKPGGENSPRTAATGDRLVASDDEGRPHG